jgi:hypothetical protein
MFQHSWVVLVCALWVPSLAGAQQLVRIRPEPLVVDVGSTVTVFVDTDHVSPSDLPVVITSSDPTVLAVPSQVTLKNGSASASFPVQGLQAGQASLTANLLGSVRVADARVLAPSAVTAAGDAALLSLMAALLALGCPRCAARSVMR